MQELAAVTIPDKNTNMSTPLYEENQLLLRTQLFKLMSMNESDLLKSHYKICSIEDSQLCISISMIKNDTIYFETYLCNNNIKSRSRRHKVFGKQFTHIIDEVMSQMTNHEIKTATNILLRKRTTPRKIVNSSNTTVTSATSTDKPRYKRNVRGKEQPSAQQQLQSI